MRLFDYVIIIIVCILVEFYSCDVKLFIDK